MTKVDPEFLNTWRRVLKLRSRGRFDLAEQLNDTLKLMISLSAEDDDDAERIALAVVEAAKSGRNHDAH